MSNYAISLKRTSLLLAALAFTALLMVVNLASLFGSADAETVSSRSLTLTSSLPGTSTTGAANSETNGADATHTIQFDPGTSGGVESIVLEWCTTALSTCDPPTDLEVNAGTTLVTQTNEGVAMGFSIASSTVNTITLEDATAETFVAGSTGTIVLAFDDITNPTDVGTFFVRIQTYANDDQTGPIDDGGVASSITEGIAITSRVAETLGFSTTGTINQTGIPAPGDNCAPLTGSGAITLGDPTEQTLALDTAYDNYSAFRLYTNASGGVAVQYNGNTLTRSTGSGDINQIGATPALSTEGSEQFGLAVDGTVGTDADVDAVSRADMDMTNVQLAASWASGGTLTIDPDYENGAGVIDTNGAEDALFAFETNAGTPATIATTAGYTECKTVPVRYLANISPTTPSGTYTTTVVYSAVPTY